MSAKPHTSCSFDHPADWPCSICGVVTGNTSTRAITTTYDPVANAAYVNFQQGRTVASTRVLAPGINADFDVRGELIGIEVIGPFPTTREHGEPGRD